MNHKPGTMNTCRFDPPGQGKIPLGSPNILRALFRVVLATSLLPLVSCGGGGAGTTSGAGAVITPIFSGVTDAERINAAKSTAEKNAQCTKIAPFYWEIGSKSAALTNGSVGTGFSATTVMSVASASKFIYAAYVSQKKAGTLSATDIKALTFRSGYTSFDKCATSDSIHSCAISGTNGTLTAANDNKFFYGGGHMQIHADQVMNLGSLTNSTLADEINNGLGLGATATEFSYTQPQLAGGVSTSPQVYAKFLRKLLDGSLKLGTQLSDNAFCATPSACPSSAVSSPFPSDETPLYGMGHWIEDKTKSDGAFSSPGLFGFYPWIDANLTSYGMVARATIVGTTSADPQVQPYTQSMYCGRLIRKAWATGVTQ
jgi:hypothetical protein